MAETIPTARLEEIRELAAKATPGKWTSGKLGYVSLISNWDRIAECRSAAGVGAVDNARYIANCDPQTVTAIIDRLIEVEAELIERRNKDKANG